MLYVVLTPAGQVFEYLGCYLNERHHFLVWLLLKVCHCICKWLPVTVTGYMLRMLSVFFLEVLEKSIHFSQIPMCLELC